MTMKAGAGVTHSEDERAELKAGRQFLHSGEVRNGKEKGKEMNSPLNSQEGI